MIPDEKAASIKLELIQYVFSFYLFLSIQNVVLRKFFYTENCICRIHGAKWKSLLVAGKPVKMLCNKISKVSKECAQLLKEKLDTNLVATFPLVLDTTPAKTIKLSYSKYIGQKLNLRILF